jgi:hypothetical protein
VRAHAIEALGKMNLHIRPHLGLLDQLSVRGGDGLVRSTARRILQNLDARDGRYDPNDQTITEKIEH